MSKPEVKQAVKDVQSGLLTAYAAAKKYNVAQSTISRALKRVVCPTCDGTGKVKK